MTTREGFLERVRQAAEKGNRTGGAPGLPVRGHCGYQGAGSDIVGRFCTELGASGGIGHIVADSDSAEKRILQLALEKKPRRVLLGSGRVIDTLALGDPLAAKGIDVIRQAYLTAGSARDTLFAADLSITGADHFIAETGSVVYLARPDEPRSLSLLPPVHIVVASADQILPDLFDLFEKLQSRQGVDLPSCVSIITGPSKTGDIELKLVTGVHGPAELHVVMLCAG